MSQSDDESTPKSQCGNPSQKSHVVATEPDRSFERYMVDEFKTKATGSKEVPFETIDLNLYSPTAKIVGFKTSEQRLRYWIEAFQLRYVDCLRKQEGYNITWEEIESLSQPGKADRIVISVSDEEKKLFVLNVFITTGRLQIRGSCYQEWAKSEFPLLMLMIDKLIQSEDTTTESQQGLFTNCAYIDKEDKASDVRDNDDSNDHVSSSDSSSDSEDETQDHDDDGCKETKVHEGQEDQMFSNSVLSNMLAALEVNFTQSKVKLENEIKSIHVSLEEVLFIKDRLVRCENNYKACLSNFDDKLRHSESRFEDMNKQIRELSTQVKKLQDNRSALINKQTEMKNTITALTNENSSLKQELFVLKEKIQKHENVLESSLKESHSSKLLQNGHVQLTSSQPSTEITTNNKPTQSTPDHLTNNQSTLNQSSTVQSSNQSSTSEPKPRDSLLLFVDSNGKFLDPNLLYPEKSVDIKRTYTLTQLKDTVNEYSSKPTAIVIHCGTNDLEKTNPESIIHRTKELLDITKKRFPSSHIIYSSLLPRQDQLQHHVNKVNHELYNYCNSSNITFISHSHIHKPSQFHDSKHLNRYGVKVFAKNLKSAIYETPTKQSRHQSYNNKLQRTEQPAVPSFPRIPRLPTQQPGSLPQQLQTTTKLHNGRPSYAQAVSSSPSLSPLVADPNTGLPTPLRTLIRQLQMFL